MTQSPPGGPPPSSDAPDERSSAPGPAGSQPPPTGYQPTYQQGPPPGYQPGPPPGYQPGPPPGYQQAPPPGYQQGPPPGYQPGPPPGYQPGPPPGYQQGPPPGYDQGPPLGYQQQPGYPPQGAYGPPGGQPGYPGAPGGYPPAAGPKPSFDMSKISVSGWGVLGSAALTFIVSFLPFWSVSGISGAWLNGWHQWWALPVLLALTVGVVFALDLFGVIKPGQVKPEWLAYAAAGSFVLMLGVMIQTFIYAGGYSSDLASFGISISFGPGFGVFAAVVTTAALTYFMALAAQSAGAKLPFKVPGPA